MLWHNMTMTQDFRLTWLFSDSVLPAEVGQRRSDHIWYWTFRSVFLASISVQKPKLVIFEMHPSLKHPCKGPRTILLSRMPEIQTTPKDLFGFHFGGFSKSLNPCRRKQFRIDVLSWISFAPQLSLLKSLWSVDNIWNKSLYTQCANVIIACTNYFRQVD